ncbi:MAG: DUF5916 domain-containing protein [Bacteroidota bacterium]
MLILLADGLMAQNNLDFPPPDTPLTIQSRRAEGMIVVDGKLDESDWERAASTTDFFRREPRQGGEAHFPTTVKFLFDDKYLYVGVFCEDSAGIKGIRVRDLRRDFGGSSDQVGIAFDPQNLKQYAQVFETTPYANQSDFQNFNGNNYDSGWNTLWKVRTQRTERGYFAEFAIPFKSLRYNKPTAGEPVTWGITMQRRALRDFEVSCFPAIPQSMSMFRMTYAAQLEGIEPPPPAANLRVSPYALFRYDNIQTGGETTTERSVRFGGDAKWAINPQSVLDVTVNTDFAQADVDQAVNNLERFNIFFPERRQFFLENSGIWAGAAQRSIRPFFSRRIGLQGEFNARPAPITVGSRFTQRTEKRAIAGLFVRQRATENSSAANFGVLRYLRNYGAENNMGIMATHRLDESDSPLGLNANHNTTITIDGQIRPNNRNRISYLASTSIDEESGRVGYAGRFFAGHSSNKLSLNWLTEVTDENYNPRMGFVRQNNVIRHSTGGYYIWRPKKMDWIRRWDPGLQVDFNHDATNPTNFQQASIFIFPVYTWFKDNSFLELAVNPIWQNINFDFAPLGLPIAEGNYFYNRFFGQYYTDQSRKLSGTFYTGLGQFYNGTNSSFGITGRYAPIPHIALSVSYDLNALRGIGIDEEDLRIQLLTVGSRFALNPRLQLSTFYQFNSFDQQGRWNIRASWEYQPLSFIYLVFNDSRINNQLDPFQEQQVITKITYVKQF